MKKIMWVLLLSSFSVGFTFPETIRIPVSGATRADWNPQSFWYYPWGRSGTHKGIDIFAQLGTPVVASTYGLVIHAGVDSVGGNVIWILGAKWRLHYYAHLQQIDISAAHWVKAGDTIGKVGTSGNAKGKAPHLHYAIRTLYPQWWEYQSELPQAWDRLFYVDPHAWLITEKRPQTI